MGLFSWLDRLGPSAEEIRAEVWRLGVRHNGEPLAGAREELAGPGVPAGRVVLLRACIRAMTKA